MAIDIKKIKGAIYAVFPNELGELQKSNLTSLLVLGDDLDRFLEPIRIELQLRRPSSIKGSLSRLRALGEAFCAYGITSLPTSHSNWQQLILDVHRFIMTRTDRKSSLQTRQSCEWQDTRKFFSILIDEGIAPVSIYLPPVREVLSSIDITRYNTGLLGQSVATIISGTSEVDKLLMKISLARTDSEYLEEVRDTLAFRRRILLEALTDYWHTLKSNMDFGRHLISLVSWEQLEPELRKIGKRNRADIHPANPMLGKSELAKYLTIIKYAYDGCPPTDDTLRTMQKENEYLPRLSCLGPINEWTKSIDAPRNFASVDSRLGRNVLWWWQGRISHLDVSMITALLIMLQPSWTPQAVLQARVSNRNGKHYLQLSDIGAIFEINKPRATSMKKEVLDPLSQQIIETLIQIGEPLRNELRESNSQLANLLLLPYGRTNKVSSPKFATANSFLSGTNSRFSGPNWIGAIYPGLTKNGLGEGMITFSKIRKTEGVLEWFRTKSLKAVSRKLGNTERVVLHHYIPKSLLDGWNTRMIRRFQNLWISIATADEDFQLHVSDFNCLEDLHIFLRDMLKLHLPGTSPLASEMHNRFISAEFNKLPQPALIDGHLHVAISSGSLGALYSYQVQILELGLSRDLLERKDPTTGISPHSFLELADLLQSQLPLDKNPRFRNAHDAAMRIVSERILGGQWKFFPEGITK